MASQPSPDEYDYREEGCSLFEWPLTDEALHMGAGELLDSLIDTIRRLNSDPQWDRTLLFRVSATWSLTATDGRSPRGACGRSRPTTR